MKSQKTYSILYFKLTLLAILILNFNLLQAQVDTAWVRQHAETSRKAYEEGNRNKAKLIAEGKWNLNKMPGTVYLRTPIESMSNMHDYGFYHIENLVDLDPSPIWSNTFCMFSTNWLYGMHTFNGCTGTEFQFTREAYPVMDEKIGRVTAAADGIIVAKADGNFDKNCSGTTGSENYIALEHSDGTRTYYYNLKNGDQNPKPIGSLVSEGELLGYPGGSGSGSSSNYNINIDERAGLFFELRDNANNVIDPFGAPGCLGLPQYPTRWKDSINIRDYAIDIGLVHLKTHKHKQSAHDNCGNNIINYTKHFNPGDSIYLDYAFKNFDLTYDSFLVDIYNPLGIPILPTYIRPKSCCNTIWLELLNYSQGFKLPTGGLMIPGTYQVLLSLKPGTGYQFFYRTYFTVGCQSDYYPTGNVTGEKGLIAGNNIVSNENFFNGSRAEYIAGNEIILTPGFIAYNGSYVMLYNEACIVPPRIGNDDVLNDNNEITLAPNPANDFVTLKISNDGLKTTFNIYNNTLQLIKSINFESGIENKIDTKDFANGIYFIEAQANGEVYSGKFVVQH